MVLKRFPWKIPDPELDPSFKLFLLAHPELGGIKPSSLLEDDEAHDEPMISDQLPETRYGTVLQSSGAHRLLDQYTGDGNVNAIPTAKEAGYDISLAIPTSDESTTVTPVDTNDGQVPRDIPPSHEEHHDLLYERHYHEQELSSEVHSPKDHETSKEKNGTSPDEDPQPRAADSLFRILPLRPRMCLSRMLVLDPKNRATLGDLLRGRSYGGTDGAISATAYAQQQQAAEAEQISPLVMPVDTSQIRNNTSKSAPYGTMEPYVDEFENDEDYGDEWLKGINTCSHWRLSSTTSGSSSTVDTHTLVDVPATMTNSPEPAMHDKNCFADMGFRSINDIMSGIARRPPPNHTHASLSALQEHKRRLFPRRD